jgi:hypothetical protein
MSKILLVYSNKMALTKGFWAEVSAAQIVAKPENKFSINRSSKILSSDSTTWYFCSLDNLDYIRGLEYDRWYARGKLFLNVEPKVQDLLNSHCRGIE